MPKINPRRVLKERETKQIIELRSQINDQELIYQKIRQDQLSLSSLSKEWDELNVKANLVSVEIDNIKKKIEHVIRTGRLNGNSLDKGFKILTNVSFD